MTISPARHDTSIESPDPAELLIREARRKGRRRRLKFALLVTLSAAMVIALVLIVVGGIPVGTRRLTSGRNAPPTGTNLSSAAALAMRNTSLLYTGHGVGVVATYNETTGCSQAFLTNDFVHWRNITPPLKRTPGVAKGQCLFVWIGAAFSSPSVGWLMARDGGGSDTILRHTVDGGRTWVTQPGGDTGSQAGTETIGFVNAHVGWRQQFGFGSNSNYALQRTLDGGATWSTRTSNTLAASPTCTFAQDVFSSASIGFAYSSWQSTSNASFLLRTVDGGLQWSRLTFPAPAPLPPNARGLYGEPEFVGADGVEPVDYPVNGRQVIDFFTTHDRGLTWRVDTNSMLPIIVKEPMTLNPETRSGVCDLDFAATTGRVASISMASLSTWWILEPGPKGATKRLMVTNGGAAVSSFEITDLPATTGQMEFSALNTNDALITRPIPNGYQTTYQSTDGGATWSKLKL